MAKWADWCVTAVGYNEDKSRIVEVEVRPDTGDTIGSASRKTRQRVIEDIERGVSFNTIFLTEGKWTRGAMVEVVVINGQKFLRTDRNQRTADNLGALPEFTPAPQGAARW